MNPVPGVGIASIRGFQSKNDLLGKIEEISIITFVTEEILKIVQFSKILLSNLANQVYELDKFDKC